MDSIYVFLDKNPIPFLGVVNRSEPFPKMLSVQMLIPHDAEVVFIKGVPILRKPLVVESASFPCQIKAGWIRKVHGFLFTLYHRLFENAGVLDGLDNHWLRMSKSYFLTAGLSDFIREVQISLKLKKMLAPIKVVALREWSLVRMELDIQVIYFLVPVGYLFDGVLLVDSYFAFNQRSYLRGRVFPLWIWS